MNELSTIALKYEKFSGLNRGTGGNNTGGDKLEEGYTDIYSKYFNSIKNNKINLLEIGVFQGRSIAMWSDYFHNGNIYGLDINLTEFNLFKEQLINKYVAFKNDNIKMYQENSLTCSPQVINELPNLDIILDDGAHTYGAQLQTFNIFWNKLNHKGYYIIEDATDKSAKKLIRTIKSIQNNNIQKIWRTKTEQCGNGGIITIIKN